MSRAALPRSSRGRAAGWTEQGSRILPCCCPHPQPQPDSVLLPARCALPRMPPALSCLPLHGKQALLMLPSTPHALHRPLSFLRGVVHALEGGRL